MIRALLVALLVGIGLAPSGVFATVAKTSPILEASVTPADCSLSCDACVKTCTSRDCKASCTSIAAACCAAAGHAAPPGVGFCGCGPPVKRQ